MEIESSGVSFSLTLAEGFRRVRGLWPPSASNENLDLRDVGYVRRRREERNGKATKATGGTCAVNDERPN